MTNTLTKKNKKNKKNKKRGPYKYTAEKRKLIVSVYQETGGSISKLIENMKISRTKIYEIFDKFPEVRRGIDDYDVAKIEGLKDKALAKLEENIDANLQSAIQYALEKEPRKERGKIVVNRDDNRAEEIELYIGVRQKVIIE